MPSILIIDNQPYTHELFCHVLMKESHQVVNAGSVESVRRYLENSVPDLFFSKSLFTGSRDGQTSFPLSQLHKLLNKNQCQEEQHEI